VSDALLSVEGLEVVYHRRHGVLQALHDVSFTVQPGEIVGIVGESGCGKSTLSSALMRLLPPNGEIAGGRILFQGRDIAELGDEALRRLRGPGMAMIFQDPLTSLPSARTRPDAKRGSFARAWRRCSRGWGSPTRSSEWTPIRTNSRVGCGNAS
jgi:ABC-type glutathione transport system ATPase component